MSGIAALEKILGPLGDAYKALAVKWSPEVVEQSSKVGGVFSELAAKDPAYFATSRELPRGTTQERANFLTLKHKLPSPLVDDQLGGIYHSPEYTGGTGASLSYTGDKPADLVKRLDAPDMPGWRKKYIQDQLEFAKTSGMDPSKEFLHADMIGAEAGSGMAKKLYPAFYEYALSHPGTAVLTDSLTPANLQKRAMYQAALLEKYPQARNMINTLPEQLDSLHGNAGNLAAFNKMSAAEQAGVLNMITANNTQAKLAGLIDSAKGELWARNVAAAENPTPKAQAQIGMLEEAMNRLKKLGIGSDGKVGSSVNVDEVTNAIGALARQMKLAQPVGKDSLRRSILTNEILSNPGFRSEDTMGSELTRHLAKAKGGRVTAVQKTHAAPLSQYSNAGPASSCRCNHQPD